ncbi:hypothetical protein ACWDR2_40580 [Streptomyces sp. NPDC003631]|uniref:hypothetical protein n=1 Tax=unclassified Streptomyces TaxID=2593676 RepID=UPI002EC62852|nr:hypothetical protein [Streptomyces sp. WAC07094]
MGSLLRSVSGVRWADLRDATGAPAGGIPPLLSRIAYGDEDTARTAIQELGDAVCALGFVVGEATAPAVPFLVELAGAPQVACKAELLDLLGSIYQTDQWHSAAVAARSVESDTSYRQQPGWEAAARTAVYAGLSVIECVATSVRPEEATAAKRLLQILDHIPPFPEL